METLPQSTQADPVLTTQEPTNAVKPPKDKKERTEAQKAATAKALAAMTEARRAKAKVQIAKKEEVKKAKKVVEEKILKENVGFVMKDDFETMKSSMMKEIGELRAMYANSQQAIAKPIEKANPVRHEKIVERIVERVPTSSAQPSKLTGHPLLDRVFGFDK